MFDLYQDWLEKVFKQIDKKGSKSRSHHLLAMAQGAALMSHVYSEIKILREEFKVIEEWIDSL